MSSPFSSLLNPRPRHSTRWRGRRCHWPVAAGWTSASCVSCRPAATGEARSSSGLFGSRGSVGWGWWRGRAAQPSGHGGPTTGAAARRAPPTRLFPPRPARHCLPEPHPAQHGAPPGGRGLAWASREWRALSRRPCPPRSSRPPTPTTPTPPLPHPSLAPPKSAPPAGRGGGGRARLPGCGGRWRSGRPPQGSQAGGRGQSPGQAVCGGLGRV